jgi:hypothetical protein
MIAAAERKNGERPVDPKNRSELYKPIDRDALSENALSLLDQYQIDDANDPIAIFVSIVDKMVSNQREVISRFEVAIAFAGVEFGRIDLAIEKAEETQKQAEALVSALSQTQKDFAATTNKIRERSNFDILLNHLKPFVYGIFGAVLTLLVLFILRIRIL